MMDTGDKMRLVCNSILVVPPFECAWLSRLDQQFLNPGCGCVSFEARAENDITVVFKADAGAKHYRTDTGRNYTVVFGSHGNRRLKIEVDGEAVAELPGFIIKTACFDRYWVNLNAGVLSVGLGQPGAHTLLQWTDPHPNSSVRYVGLSTWDKHASYREIQLAAPCNPRYPHNPEHPDTLAPCPEPFERLRDLQGHWALSDVTFVATTSTGTSSGPGRGLPSVTERLFPAHRLVLAGRGCEAPPGAGARVHVRGGHAEEVVSALLDYCYKGEAEVPRALLRPLSALAAALGCHPLVDRCLEELGATETTETTGTPQPTRATETTETSGTTGTTGRFDGRPVADPVEAVEADEPCVRCPVEGEGENAAEEEGPTTSGRAEVDLWEGELRGEVEGQGAGGGRGEERVALRVVQGWLESGRVMQLLSSGALTDVTLLLDGSTVLFPSHKLVLGLWSKPFAKMFTCGMRESWGTDVCLVDVAEEPLRLLLQFMYSGRVPEAEAALDWPLPTLLAVLLLADRFGVDQLFDVCCGLVKGRLSEDCAYEVLGVVNTVPRCRELVETCIEACARAFDVLASAPAEGLCQLEFDEVQRVVQHPRLQVASEERLLHAILLWAGCSSSSWEAAEGSPSFSGALSGEPALEELLGAAAAAAEACPDRRDQLEQLLSGSVRFPLMPSPVLHKLVASQLVGLLPLLQDLVLEGIEFQDGVDEQGLQQLRPPSACPGGTRVRAHPEGSLVLRGRLVEFAVAPLRFCPRVGPGHTELLYQRDGDGGGVVHHAGTSCGQHPWMNPVLSKKVTISASSPPSRHTDPKVIASGQFQATSYAGPCVENQQLTSWWMLDLGAGHQLMCNFYTLRQDGSSNFMRSWALQGSMDGATWVDLRKHEGDRTLCRPGQYASWPIVGPRALLPCRFFRVKLTGACTDAASPWHMCICFFEFYGHFL